MLTLFQFKPDQKPYHALAATAGAFFYVGSLPKKTPY